MIYLLCATRIATARLGSASFGLAVRDVGEWGTLADIGVKMSILEARGTDGVSEVVPLSGGSPKIIP